MRHPNLRRPLRLTLLAGSSALLLAACNGPLDFDLRGTNGGFTTANAATGPLAARPKPDDRGVISYPNYQVIIAQRGDTLAEVAARVGADTDALARYNGIDKNVPLRKGEVIALPNRVSEPSPATGAQGTGPIQPVDISTLAGGAIDRAPAAPGVQTAALPPANADAQTGKEPVRHKVERGETAYTISRLYKVPVKSLAEWNGLGSDFKIREGQFLLIPVAQQNPPKATQKPLDSTNSEPLPGTGSPTPTPPSAAKPLPKASTAAPTIGKKSTKPVADVGKTTKPVAEGKFLPPVNGTVIREYTKGKNEGINLKAADGTPVRAADAGVVAAITKSGEGIPIVVIRHPDNLLTVYANVTGVAVAKGDKVKRGQSIAKLRTGNDAYVHFEVRKGFDSVDPGPYLN